MLKKDIPYLDFDGEPAIETAYFNLTKVELAQMEFEHDGGMSKMLQDIIATNDRSAILATFEKIIGRAYGVRSEDGRRFKKSPELFEEFKETLAYDALVMQLATDNDLAAQFIVGIVPQDLDAQSAVKEAFGGEDVQLPATLTETLDEPDPTPWLTEDRDPTKAERRQMTREQLVEAIKARDARKTRLEQEAAEDKERASLEAAFDETE